MMAMIYVLCSLTLKAFDSVPHQLLLKKLAALELPPALFQWLKDYLTNRHQQVKVARLRQILHILDWLGISMLKDSLTLATCCLLTKRFGSNPAALLSGK